MIDLFQIITEDYNKNIYKQCKLYDGSKGREWKGQWKHDDVMLTSEC